MAYTNLPPNLYDYFSTINQRIRKLESAPDQAMTTATQATVQSTQALQAAQYANTQATTAIALANTKNTVFYSGTAPTANAVNDQWIDTAAGNKLYIWNGTVWTSAQDAAIAAAQTTANGKNTIYRQGTAPSGGTYAVGDMWFNTSLDNAISTWNGSAWAANALGTNALANFSANKITSGTIDASVVNVSNINAGNISSGYLAASRIQVGSLNADVLTSNTITATQIAAGTITSTEISSSYVYAGTIAASQITAGTLTGFTIQTSTGTSAVTLNGSSNSIDFKSSGSTVGHIVPLNISGTTYGVIMHYGSSPDGSGSTYPQVYVGGSNVSMGANSTYLFSSTTSGNAINGAVNFNGAAYALGNRTGTSSTANGYFNSSSGYWTYSTASSERYKNSIVDLDTVPDLASSLILKLRPRAFKYNDDYLLSTDQRYEQLMPGFISEEIQTVLPIAVDIQDGQVETWNERMLIPGMVALIQQLNTRLAKLEGANGTTTSA
jgi:hypothetical protein